MVKHHCVEMVQGSKGGSHSCSRNWNFKVPCPRAVPLLCVGAETDIWTQCLSPCTWPYAILARLLSPVGGPQRVFTQALVLRKNGEGMNINLLSFLLPLHHFPGA